MAIILVIFLAGCEKERGYEPIDIQIVENEKLPPPGESLQINGLYEITRATPIFADPGDLEPIDTLDPGSTVKILGEQEAGFVRIEYFGSHAYLRADNLKEI